MKALIVIDSVHIGGIGTSFIPFVKNISRYVKCDILPFDSSNLEMFHDVPYSVNVLESNWILKMLAINDDILKRENIIIYYFKIFLENIARKHSAKFVHKLLFMFLRKKTGYDIAISYRHDENNTWIYPGCNSYIKYNVDAKVKMSYMHADVSFSGYFQFDKDDKSLFDFIVCVSNGAKESFIKKYPSIKEKCLVCENFVDVSSIIAKSVDSYDYDKNVINLFSACRLCEQKGIIRALKIIEKINMPDKLRWYIAGDGPLKEQIMDIIKNSSILNQSVIYLGALTNPFPYIVKADAFFLPSYYEASPVVYSECRVLGVPIITTKTCSANELVSDRNLGIVCENSEEGIYNVLYDLCMNNLKLPDSITIKDAGANAMPESQLNGIIDMLIKQIENHSYN